MWLVIKLIQNDISGHQIPEKKPIFSVGNQ